ncbi:MAG: type II secretion system protein GspD, partial [Deltaproteobacteria bacterium]
GGKGTTVTIDFVNTPVTDLIKYFAEITGRNFLLTDDLKGEVTIISHKPVTVGEAYEAFLSALESVGYTTVTVGQLTKVVPTGDASSSPLREYYGGNIPYTDNYVTQIIQLENVSVGDVSGVVKELAGSKAKVIAYSPTNTLIITDSAVNIRRVYRIVSQLDVAAPRSRLEIIPLQNAQASEVQRIIEEIYGGDSSSSANSNTTTNDRSNRRSSSRRNRRSRNRDTPASSSASSTTVGKEGNFIDKIITDERTNSLIVLANDEAIQAIIDLVARIDIDVDPQSRARIHVVYLEHAKAEDVASVLSNLSENSSSSRRSGSRSNRTTQSGRGSLTRGGRDGGRPALPDAEESPSAVAALDGGVRITSDENTNSLVIVATPDQFEILSQVIKKLDIRRKQVFVQAVVLEMASDDTYELGLGVHGGIPNENGDGGFSFGSAQLGGSSLGLSQDSLSGLALGVYGQSFEVSLPDLTGSGTSTTLSIPAFGVALNALASNSAVDIVATPEILTMANEEAKIVVGRNVPFPVSTGRDNNGQPIVSYQREDVATTLKVTPQINESNFVTLELFQEVTEIEEDSKGLDVTSAGFITSKRSAETTVVVHDNQTVVIGGLIGSTDTHVETKIPILGDLPLVGNLFRGKRDVNRKTNLLIFLTPHIIDDPADLEEVYRIKWAQREEFIRRFYGKSKEEQEAELARLLRYSMNRVDQPSPWRTKPESHGNTEIIGGGDGGVVVEGTTATMDDPGPQALPGAAAEPAATDEPDGTEAGALPTGGDAGGR